jgi:hypothetical protein
MVRARVETLYQLHRRMQHSCGYKWTEVNVPGLNIG